jgi:pSer/pThr/pTyr-binding forkhead associated (FHA) protein
MPSWPGPPPERETAVSPARNLTPDAPPARIAEPTPTPGPAPPAPARPAAFEPAPAGGLPAGVERSVYGVYLVVERGRDRGRVFPLNRQVTVLGRSGTEILINDPDISRRHAAIDVQGEGKYVLRDS